MAQPFRSDAIAGFPMPSGLPSHGGARTRSTSDSRGKVSLPDIAPMPPRKPLPELGKGRGGVSPSRSRANIYLLDPHSRAEKMRCLQQEKQKRQLAEGEVQSLRALVQPGAGPAPLPMRLTQELLSQHESTLRAQPMLMQEQCGRLAAEVLRWKNMVANPEQYVNRRRSGEVPAKVGYLP
mmetsp:Transcript_66110/g.158157  ORF Transcript_66110/g.158157 Transcript_66110/m.158157 type:complete len:180 (+) Transcript_66110:162-701(+)